MDIDIEIIQGFYNLARRLPKTVVSIAKVTAVDEASATVDVVDVEGNEIFDVRLKAALDLSDHGINVFPEVGSWVLIANIGLSEKEWVVISTTNISKIIVNTSTTTLEIAGDGVAISRGVEDLKTLLTDLLTAITQLTVTCAAAGSPSSPPINLAAFTSLQTRLNSLLK